MNLTDYLPVLIQLSLAVVIASAILVASHFLGQRSAKNKYKDSVYECGLASTGDIHPRFAVKFYVIAMLFILFDIEIVFMFPWVMIYRQLLAHAVPILLPMLFFLGLLVVGFLYEYKKDALKWEL